MTDSNHVKLNHFTTAAHLSRTPTQLPSLFVVSPTTSRLYIDNNAP